MGPTRSAQSLVYRLSRILGPLPLVRGITRRIYRILKPFRASGKPKGSNTVSLRPATQKRELIMTPNHIAAKSKAKPVYLLLPCRNQGRFFIQSAIHHTTGLEPMTPSHGYFLEDMLNVESMIKFVEGGYVAR